MKRIRSNADLIRQPKTGRKLTPKMMLFCQAYVCNGWNATQAAITAGYSEKVARTMGAKLVAKGNISDQIQYVRNHIEENIGLSKEMILAKEKEIAFGKKTIPAERQKAIEVINKMMGYDAPIRHDVLVVTAGNIHQMFPEPEEVLRIENH